MALSICSRSRVPLLADALIFSADCAAGTESVRITPIGLGALARAYFHENVVVGIYRIKIGIIIKIRVAVLISRAVSDLSKFGRVLNNLTRKRSPLVRVSKASPIFKKQSVVLSQLSGIDQQIMQCATIYLYIYNT